MEFINHALLIISISSLLFSSSAAEADCIPVAAPSPGPTASSPSPSLGPTASSPSLGPTASFPSLGPTASSPSLGPTASSRSPSLSPSPSLPPCSSPRKAPAYYKWSSEGLPSALPVVDPAIRDVCGRTGNVLLCLSSIAPYLGAKNDVMSVLAMEIKATKEASQHALDAISAMVHDPSTPSHATKMLSVCKENYDSAVDDLQVALEAIPTGDIGSILTHLSAVDSDIHTCEDSFAEASYGSPTPTAKFYDPIYKLTSNCLDIANFLHS